MKSLFEKTKILSKIKRLVSNSPIVDITYSYNNHIRHVYSQLGWFSLTGSIKDRVAYQIFYDGIKNNQINSNTKVVEVSSGNMGISVCAIANMLKLDTTIIMPKSMSEERKKLIQLFGAKLVLVDNFIEAFKLCEEYEKNAYFCPHQFENESNITAHYNITGRELFSKIKNKNISSFVSGIGTAGTLMGAGKFLKEKMDLKMFAIEPKNAPILTKSSPLKKHSIQGLSDEIVPKIYDENLVDSIIQIEDNDAIAMSQKLCNELSLGVGVSGGANFLGCVLSETDAVTTFADSNKKYLSTNLTQNVQSKLVDKIKLISIEIL